MALPRPLAALVVLSMLGACGGGGGPSVSGSASESARSESGLSAMWSKVRGLTVESGRTVEMPALGLMADAFLRDAQVRNLSPARTIVGSLYGDPGSVPTFDRQIAEVTESLRGTKPNAASPLDVEHGIYAVPILVALHPRKGWEVEAINDCRVDPRFDTPFFRKHRPPCRYDEQAHMRYMEMLATSAIYTNDVFALLGEKLGGTRLADPDEAQRRVIAAFQAIPAATLAAALKRASDQVVGGSFTTDLTGSGNVHFTHAPAGDFVGDARGVTWTKAGGVWFGDSRIAGQSVNFRLASTSSLAQSQSQSGNQGTSAGAEVQGSGGVGAGR